MKKYFTSITLLILSGFAGIMNVMIVTIVCELYPFALSSDITLFFQDILFIIFQLVVIIFIVRKKIFNYKNLWGIIKMVCFIIIMMIIYIIIILITTEMMYSYVMSSF